MELQKRQWTVRSHGLITDNYYDIIYRYSAIYIVPREYREIVRLHWIYDGWMGMRSSPGEKTGELQN